MEPQFHLETNYDNSYYQEVKPEYNHQYNPHTYFNNEAPISTDFSFFPENNLYDTVISSPLDATRQSTDVTDASDMTPVNYKTYPQFPIQQQQQQQQQPVYQNFPFQDFTNNYPNMRNPFFQNPNQKFPCHFPPQQMAHYNNSFNASVPNPLEVKIQHVQPLQPPIVQQMMPQFTQQVKEVTQVKELEEDEDEEIENPQLKSLLDFNIWSPEKDEMLLKLGTQYKFDWKKISKKFNNKKITPNFLKIRYKELTCAPVQRRIKFNHKEDLMIAKYFEKYGSNWAQMSVHFENRTAIMLKNRYYSFIRKRDLLPILISEVRDIERENLDVDALGIQEAEKYTSSLELKMAYEQNGHSFLCKVESNFSVDRNQSQQTNNSNINSQNEKQTKEIEILKAKIKSLQALFVKTKTELDQLKSQK